MKKVLISLNILFFAMLFLLGCDSSSTTPKNVDTKQQTYNKYKALWDKSGIQSYTFVMERTCFCPIEENTQVKVAQHTLVEAKYIPSNRPYNKEQLSYLKTINQYFNLIQEAIDNKVYKLTVTYDKTYGYPSYIYIDTDKQMVDEEISYTLTHFNQTVDEEPIAVCTQEYAPVCGSVKVQCITAPCESINQTFSNICMLNANSNATYLRDGEC